MFKKLRVKLTVFNAVILIIFMFVFSSIIFIFLNGYYDRTSLYILKSSAERVQNLYQIPPTGRYPIKKNIEKIEDKIKNFKEQRHIPVNYILWDNDMDITAISQNDINDIVLGSKIFEYAREANRGKRPRLVTTELNGEKIQLYTIPFKKNGQQGVVQVFRSIGFERFLLSRIMVTLIVMELCSVIVLVGIGWFLAGKSLVPIKKSWQQQKDFVADASHELRTPLTVIQTNIEVALSDPEGKISDNIQWLNNSYTETKVMGKLINDLLLIAKIDAKQIELERKILNLSRVAMEVSQQMDQIFKTKHIQFKKSIQQEVKFDGDESRIRQLILSLLDNAHKYTPTGGEVTLAVKSKKDSIELIVSDTGVGIAEEDKKRIFDRFFRVDKTRSRDQGGTGLGLSIAAWIVKSHNGKIKVESKIGEGSSFIVEIPNTKYYIHSKPLD